MIRRRTLKERFYSSWIMASYEFQFRGPCWPTRYRLECSNIELRKYIIKRGELKRTKEVSRERFHSDNSRNSCDFSFLGR